MTKMVTSLYVTVFRKRKFNVTSKQKKLGLSKKYSLFRRRFQEVVQGKRIPTEMEIARDVTAVGRQIQKETDILRLQDVHTDPVYYSYCENPNVSKLQLLLILAFVLAC
jgi:hypothetical protein